MTTIPNNAPKIDLLKLLWQSLLSASTWRNTGVLTVFLYIFMHFEHDKKVKHLNTIRLSNIDSLNLNIVKYNKLFSIYVKDKYNTNNNLELQKTAMLKDSFSKNIAALGDSIKVERQKTMWQIFNGL